MNRVYRLVWSEAHSAFIPAAEIARRRKKRAGTSKVLAGTVLSGMVSIAAHAGSGGVPTSAMSGVGYSGAVITAPKPALKPVLPTALPTAPTVTAGQATVTTTNDQMLVNETSATAAINWKTFDVGAAASVTFVQPTSSSVVLNRVLSADPSQIYGTIKANGIVFIVNPQGIIVGRGAEVNVGGLVASTLDLSDQDLLNGSWSFTASPKSGTVSNAGTIHVTPGGFAALLGSKVENSGSISAKLGSVALASGNKITLDFDDSGLLKVGVDQAALNALVVNSGAVVADGGRIILTAKSANDVLGTVVNNSGVLQAQSIGMHDGQVWLMAADPLANTGANGASANANAVQSAAGGVTSSGLIDVSGNAAASAGQATLDGTTVLVTGAIDAQNAGGAAGRVLLNSTQATTLATTSTVVDSSSTAGGKVVVWSDGATTALGNIDGRGIGQTGAGATVEVSAGQTLDFGAQVLLSAASHADAGTLMLDPATLVLAAGSGPNSPNVVYQSALETQSGNIVLSATGQITIDALSNNLLNLANASGLSITSQSSGGISFLNGSNGAPSGITTHNAPVSLTALGSGSLENIGTISTNGGNIALSGVFVHLAGGLDATNGVNSAGNVAVTVFGGALLSNSTSPIAGAQVLLDATYGYIGTATAPVPTATTDLTIKTGGNAYLDNTGSLTTLALTSNHLEGTPVGINITAANLQLSGADATGDGTMYSDAVRWTTYSATNPSNLAAPASVLITEDGNLQPGNINLPQSALTLTSTQGYILGGNANPVIANLLTLASPLGIGGVDFNGLNAEDDQGLPGNTLSTHAGTITANVLNPSGSIDGIVNITQQGNLFGSIQANEALIQATGDIGSSSQSFLLNTGSGGQVFNVAAAGDVYLNTLYQGNVGFNNLQAGGNLTLLASPMDGSSTYIEQASAGGNLTVTAVQANDLQVYGATSTNGSINISNDYSLEVFAATLNGTDAANRYIDLTSNYSNVVFGLISTNGPTGSAAATAPLGTININAPQGSIGDLASWEDPPPSVLRAANANLNSFYDMNIYNTGVDTYTNLSMVAGVPGSGSGNIYAALTGIDSVNDPDGNATHSIHLANAVSHNGNITVQLSNGDIDVGTVQSYYDCGGACRFPGNINLTASGSIVADGSAGGGRIAASDLSGTGGYIVLNAGGNLGTRGTGSDGTVGATYLSVSANGLDLTTHGDLFVNNDQGPLSFLNLHLGYASSTTPYFYHFASQFQTDPAAVTFNAASNSGLLTISTATTADSSGTVNLYADGDVRVQSWQSGQSDVLGIYAQNIAIDAPVSSLPALSIGDSSSLTIQAQGALTVGNLASTGTSPGDSTVDLEAYGGNLTLGKVSAANANVTVLASGGDILGSSGNQVLANNLILTNSFGAIGADPSVSGSVPIAIGVAQTLTLTNQGGGGSINLLTLNDPTALYLTLNTPAASTYAGAHFLMTPVTSGLGFSGSASGGGVTLSTLGTTGPSATAVPVVITADTPSISINSGAGPQLGIGYDLYFGNSYQNVVANLAGSTGQTVTVHLDNTSSALSSLTGTLQLSNLLIDENLYSGHAPLSVDLTLGQALNALTVTRTGLDYDPTSFSANSLVLSGSGQSFSDVETAGIFGSVPGVATLNAASTTALALTVNLQTTGVIDVGTINFGALGAVNLSTHIGGVPFHGIISAIDGVDGSNSISANTVNLSATGNYAGQATLGTSAAALNVTATNLALTSSGDIYVNTAGPLSSLSVTASHPFTDQSFHGLGYTYNYVYQIGGSTSLSATDDATDFLTSLNFSSATPLAFSFSSDRTIQVGSIDAGAAGSVFLTANGNWTSNPVYSQVPIGIEQGTGSGITAGTVSLTATGFKGHAGTPNTALEVATADLTVNVDGNINIADSLALAALNLTLTHGHEFQSTYQAQNSYAITAPNIDLTLNDYFDDSFRYLQLQNLSSSSLQSFSLSTDSNLTLGAFNGATQDFTGNRIALASNATLDLTASGSIWGQPGGGTYGLSDSASTAVADTASVIQVGTLNLHSGDNVIFSPQSGNPLGASTSIPVEVTNLSVIAAGEVAISNIGALNIVSANVTGSAYFRAVEAMPGIAAALTGGSLGAPITAGSLELVANYGDIGSSVTPVITNTGVLALDSGADIYAANQLPIATLSIDSNHNKASIGDTSNAGLNTLVITDTGTSGGAPLQLGITDLGASGGGYQITGLNAPQLAFSFETDDGISVGAITATSVALISDTASIAHIPGSGTITANSVSLTAATPGQSVGAVGANILTATPDLAVKTGGNMAVSDAFNIASFSLSIGAVTDLGTTPVYLLDNSTALHPLAFNVSADTVNNVLDINSISVSRTDAPVSLAVYTTASGIGVGHIGDAAAAGGTVTLDSESGLNVFGLGGASAGINADTVSLIARYGNIGTDFNGAAAPVVVTTDTLSALSSGDLRITSPHTIGSVTLVQVNSNPTGATWNVTTPDFALHATANNAGVFDVSSISGTTTNLEIDTATGLALGALALGSGNLMLSTNVNGNAASIESDGSNGGTPNISTTGNVALTASTGIGDVAQLTTNIAGNLSVSNNIGNAIDIAQTSNTPLVISALNQANSGSSPITVSAVTNLTFTGNLNAGNGSASPVSLTSGGDINYAGVSLTMNGGPVALSAGGSIIGGDIWQASSASLTAAGTATGSTGAISVGNVDGQYYNPAVGTITLQAAGDVTVSGQLISNDSVSIVSTNGSIYSQSDNTFSHTPTVTLTAAGDIGEGSSGSVGQWTLNGEFADFPGTLTLSAQAGGQINLASYAAVDATHLVGGGNVSLQTFGNYQGTTGQGISFGQVTSTAGSVSLTTANGDITASGVGSAITAATSINLTASQNEYFYNSDTQIGQPFNLGSSSAPLSLTAPQIVLTANGNIYATVPATGLTDLSVARTYVPYNYNAPGGQALLMPASTVLIADPSANTVLSVVDGGWASGNLSAIDANYGTALNLSYAGNNAVQLGTLTLHGGNLNLQATSPSDISITSTGGLIEANNFSFNLVDANGIDGTNGTATGGFGTALNPINTEIVSLSGSTVGPTAGVFMNQTGAITFTNLTTGGDISVTTTRASGALSANANIAIGNVTSNGGSVNFNADGAIIAATGVASPTITASGSANDGDVTLTAAAGIQLASSVITSSNANVSLTAAGGNVSMPFATLNSANGNIDVSATLGSVAMASSALISNNGNITVHAGAGGIDLSASALLSYSGSSVTTLTADSGDVTLGSINTSGAVDITATTGAIYSTPAQQNMTMQFNGIVAGAAITLNAGTGIGTTALPLSVTGGNDNTITANTTGSGANVYLVTGGENTGSPAVLDASIGGTLNVANFFNTLTLDEVQTAGNINVTQQNYYTNIVLNNVVATAPGATFTFLAPYGDISSVDTGGAVSASRIVLNALGDQSGGSLGQGSAPVNVDADVVIAVASNNIALNSVATGETKMPLVASNGIAPTVSITSAGDFLVGQIVAGQQGTVNVSSAGNIFDDGDSTTQIYAGTVNLTAVGAIGTAQTPISTTATAYDDSGTVLPGTLSAASTTSGNIYLAQTGDAILQSLTAANGSINVSINDPAHGQSTLVFADTTATDQAGNDINVTVTHGDLTVDVAQAGLTAGTVNLIATAGSLYGDGRADCCTNPNVSGNSVNLTAQNNIGAISDLNLLTGTALGVQANQSTATTSANNSQVYIQYVGNATVGSAGPNYVTPLGTSTEVLLAACGDLTLASLNLPSASLGLNAGTAGTGGSIRDGINGGASLASPDVTAASIVFGAATNVGGAVAPLWVNTPTLAASAGTGGVWINDAASAPVAVTAVTTGNGPVMIGTQGDLLIGSIYAGSGAATLASTTGAVLDGVSGGSNASSPNVTASAVTISAATHGGSASDALWVNSPVITAAAANGGVWINDASTSTVTVSSVTASGGPIVIASQGDLSVVAVNAGSGSATLNSATGSVLDGVTGGSNAGNPNVVAASVTVNAAINAGNVSDPLWVNAAVISGSATTGGVWINDAAITPVTVASITTGNGPVVIGGQGTLLIDSVNAGSGSATFNSATGAVLDGVTGGSNAVNPNVTASAVTVNSAIGGGSASDALWVNSPVISASTANGGVWINDASTAPVTVSSVTANGGPVVIGSQGTLSIVAVNAGNGSATLNSATGAVLDGTVGGSNVVGPNITAGAVTVNSALATGNASNALWVDSPVISVSTTNGGVWINDAASTPVTVASITSGTGPVVIGSQGNLLIDSVNAGSGSATLNSANGAVLDGVTGGSNANNPNITAGAVTVNAATNGGSASDALWVNAAVIAGSATTGGLWINDAAMTPVTVASITSANGPVVIGSHGNLLIDSINAGSGSATLNSVTGAVLDGATGGSTASNPNVTASAVTINSATSGGSASDALWVNAATITASALSGGVWLNDAATTPVTVASITSVNGPVVIGGRGNLVIDSINAGSGSATLTSATGAVLDGITGGANANHPNVTAGAVTVNSAVDAGNASDALWVNAPVIAGSATTGGVWINDAATTPVTVASIITGHGPVVIGAQGNLLIDSINAGTGSATLTSAAGAVLDGIPGGSNALHPNVTASGITVNAATSGGSSSDALWVNASSIAAASTAGGVWINDASTTPVTVTSVSAAGGPVVLASAGDLLIQSVNAGSGSATLTSSSGTVSDGINGGSSAARPNVTAGSVTINSGTMGGSPTDALWVNAALINASAASGVWINDSSSAPVTVGSVTTRRGPVAIGSAGDLLIDSITASNGAVTLTSTGGAVLDGHRGGSSASAPNVTAQSITVNSATDVGHSGDPLWVDVATITATASDGGVWINDASASPVTLAKVVAGGGAVDIGTLGNLIIDTVDAGHYDVTLSSSTGSLLDGMSGGSSPQHPNITGGTVTLIAAGTVGTFADRIYVNATSYSAVAPNGKFINVPPTPYPGLPLVDGVSPVTVYDAYAHAQLQPPQQLPMTLIGQPQRAAPPIDVTAELLGVALPEGVDTKATQQDATMGTESAPILGGNEAELGRKKSVRHKRKASNESRRLLTQNYWNH